MKGVWTGNYDGRREAMVVADSQKMALRALGCGVVHLKSHYHFRPEGPGHLKYVRNVLYTRPMWGMGYIETPWVLGLCELKRKDLAT